MTRSITIVNTSNWDGEDYKVISKDNRPVEHPMPDQVVILKPGDQTVIYPDTHNIVFEKLESKEPEPFRQNGDQTFPEVITFVGKQGTSS